MYKVEKQNIKFLRPKRNKKKKIEDVNLMDRVQHMIKNNFFRKYKADDQSVYKKLFSFVLYFATLKRKSKPQEKFTTWVYIIHD